MNKKITYAIFQNRNTGRKLVYYPVAKNANSSAKLFFLKHLKIDKSYWLGNDLKYFTIVSNISNMETFINGVNNFFQNKVEFPRIQTGGYNKNINLTDDQIIKLKKIYSSDYDLIGDLL